MDEFELLEPIIQVVQSFLTSKQAARTTILSKSWRSAWLTRPSLHFDLADFCRSHSGDIDPKFLGFAERTLERYENSNLRIDSFRMSIKNLTYPFVFGTLTKLVHRALNLGPTCLTFDFGDCNDDFDIPDDVFRCENLVSLAAKRCRINLNREEVCCSSLRFLSLEHVGIKCPDTIFHIISSCPLIEKLSLCHVYVDRSYDGKSFVADDGTRMTTASYLPMIMSMLMNRVNFDTEFLADLSSKLPSLKDFTLHLNEGREEILISSPTLERLDISMVDSTVKVVKLDIPSIRKITFACSKFPDELSFTSNSRGWKSCVSVTRVKCLNASWFYRLSNFIDKFKFSRISLLSLQLYDRGLFDYEAGEVRGLPTPPPEIENLTIYYDREYFTTKNCYALFDGLFQTCHPKVINIRLMSTYGTNISKFLAKRLLDARDAKVPTPNQLYYLMCGLNEYLKEARAQVFDRDVSTWRDVTLDSLANEEDSTTVRKYRDFRFHMNWKE